MPKPPLRDNPHRRNAARGAGRANSKPFEIKELLTRHGLSRELSAQQLAGQERWYARWQALAPSGLDQAVIRLIERRGQLVFYVRSASWASRLRLELPAYWDALIAGESPAPAGWRIQIQPTAASTDDRA